MAETPKWELAQKDFQSGMKYKDIAAKYDVTENAVKQWKRRYWSGKVTKVTKKVTEKTAPKVTKKVTSTGGKTPAKKRNAGNAGAKVNSEKIEGAKTNTPNSQAPPGNQNAIGNRGGIGGPSGNKFAVKPTNSRKSFFRKTPSMKMSLICWNWKSKNTPSKSF